MARGDEGADYADGLKDTYPASAKVFTEMAAEENVHRRQLIDVFQAQFGEHIDDHQQDLVSELADAGRILVAHDGARVRSTLTARAQTMRRHELANLQGQAGKADQSMQMAQVLIGPGYLLFIGYPAMIAVLGSIFILIVMPIVVSFRPRAGPASAVQSELLVVVPATG